MEIKLTTKRDMSLPNAVNLTDQSNQSAFRVVGASRTCTGNSTDQMVLPISMNEVKETQKDDPTSQLAADKANYHRLLRTKENTKWRQFAIAFSIPLCMALADSIEELVMKDAVPTYPMVALGAGLAVMIVIVLASHKLSSRGIYASFLGWGALCSVVLWAPVWLAYSFQQIYPRAILLAALFSTAFLVVFRKSARALKIGLPGILWIQASVICFGLEPVDTSAATLFTGAFSSSVLIVVFCCTSASMAQAQIATANHSKGHLSARVIKLEKILHAIRGAGPVKLSAEIIGRIDEALGVESEETRTVLTVSDKPAIVPQQLSSVGKQEPTVSTIQDMGFTSFSSLHEDHPIATTDGPPLTRAMSLLYEARMEIRYMIDDAKTWLTTGVIPDQKITSRIRNKAIREALRFIGRSSILAKKKTTNSSQASPPPSTPENIGSDGFSASAETKAAGMANFSLAATVKPGLKGGGLGSVLKRKPMDLWKIAFKRVSNMHPAYKLAPIVEQVLEETEQRRKEKKTGKTSMWEKLKIGASGEGRTSEGTAASAAIFLNSVVFLCCTRVDEIIALVLDCLAEMELLPGVNGTNEAEDVPSDEVVDDTKEWLRTVAGEMKLPRRKSALRADTEDGDEDRTGQEKSVADGSTSGSDMGDEVDEVELVTEFMGETKDTLAKSHSEDDANEEIVQYIEDVKDDSRSNERVSAIGHCAGNLIPRLPSAKDSFSHVNRTQQHSFSAEVPSLLTSASGMLTTLGLRSGQKSLSGSNVKQADAKGHVDRQIKSKALSFLYRLPMVVPNERAASDIKLKLGRVFCWDFNIFDFATTTQAPLTMICIEMMRRLKLLSVIPASPRRLSAFLLYVEKNYCYLPSHPNPYHTNVHAADVVQAVGSMIWNLKTMRTLDRRDLFSLLFSAAVHDFRHPGVNNLFLVKTSHALALRYNDESVLESFHVSEAFETARRFKVLDAFSNEEITRFRTLVIKCVLATDLAKGAKYKDDFVNLLLRPREAQEQKLQAQSQAQARAQARRQRRLSLNGQQIAIPATRAVERSTDSASDARPGSSSIVASESVDASALDVQHQHILMCMALKCADVSHAARPSALHIKWSQLITEEFYCQGRLESSLGLPISPLCNPENHDLPHSQLGFMRFVVFPAFSCFCSFIGPEAAEMEDQLLVNESMWKDLEEKGYKDVSEDIDVEKLVAKLGPRRATLQYPKL